MTQVQIPRSPATARSIADRPEQAPSGGRRKPRKGWWRLVAALVGVLILNIPFLTALFSSVRTTGDIAAGPFNISGGATFLHFKNVWSGAGYNFPGFYLNSLQIGIGTTIMVLAIAYPATFAIVRLGFGGESLLRISASLRVLPAIFFVIPFYLLFGRAGLLDTVWALIFANAFLNLPLAVLLLASAFSDFPDELESAALVDGCGPVRILFQICTPIMRSTLVSAALLVFLFSWSEYLFALSLSTEQAIPLTVGTASFVTSAGVQWGEIAAATVMSVIPPILLAVFTQRHMVGGLTSGALKG